VKSRGNRQKFRDALDEAENDGLKKVHEVIIRERRGIGERRKLFRAF
jgi:hypothetical protein